MWKRAFVLIVITLALVSQSFASDNKKLGLGVVLGAPTGFSMKYWQGSVAYQGSIGAGFEGGLAIGFDYLMHSNAFNDRRFPFYYGPGLFMGDVGFAGPTWRRGDLALGVRAVFGVDYVLPDHPFDIAFELGPALLLTPVTGIGIEVGLAFRFYP